MNDEEMMEKFTRIRIENGLSCLEVMKIGWDGPHNPVSDWVSVKHFFEPLSERQERDERLKALQRKKYFKVCKECGDRHPDGWMHDDVICQSCAEQNHGVVY